MSCSACKPASRGNWMYVYVDLISRQTVSLDVSTKVITWKPILAVTMSDHREYNRFIGCTGYGGFSGTETEDNRLAKV